MTNNTQAVDQEYIANMRGAARKRKAQELPQYKKDDTRSEYLAKQRLEIENYLKNNPQENDNIVTLNSEAWRVVWQRVKFFTFGGSAYQSKAPTQGETKQVSVQKYNSLTAKQKERFEKIARDGSGQAVEAQRLVEMHQAAIVALVAGHITRSGKVIEAGIKAASAACAAELRRSYQMPLFEDITAAEKFHEKAWKLLRADLQHSCDQEATEYYNRSQMAEKLRACKARLHIAYHQRFTDGRTNLGWRKKSALLRKTAASICNGTFSALENGSSERKALDALADIMRKTLIPQDIKRL